MQSAEHGKRAFPRTLLRLLPLLTMLVGACGTSYAGGPRFVTGSGIWAPPGAPEGWNRSELLYYTDPGNLAPSASHAQADAMVAAAAAAWNVPTSSLSIVQGGELAEHVSSANSFFDGLAMEFPADVQSSNENAIPVPVIYDTDGSITELLLGEGTSEPSQCRQYGVTESVDDIQMDGNIHHALLVLNGRCVGAAPEQLTQMQYQLMRAFGRVLGLSWSQTNDNVFTAATTVTADQEQYWPVMHPLDVICGPYTYQCMSNPFTLRVDDLDSLSLLYSVGQDNPPQGKRFTGAGSVDASGTLSFPTGQGMDWVNVVAHRQHGGVSEGWDTASVTTGYLYLQQLSNPVIQVQPVSEGNAGSNLEGAYAMPRVPVDTISNVFFTSEAINPLYSGEYALAPYVRPPVSPSGSSQTSIDWSALGGGFGGNLMATDAANSCSTGNDGTESAPASLDPSGWQGGLLCGWGHNSWWGTTVRAGRSWTLEVTATDESGSASTNKMLPVLGVWGAGDPTGTLPTLASQAVPFNSMALGMTQMQMPAAATDTPLRFVVSDQFGAGRPDFTYTARMLYADSVAPASVGAGGGTITIAGTGFRQGNLVQVNGVPAAVQSWTSTQIVAVAPALALAGVAAGTPVDVTVLDASTGGNTAVSSGLLYTNAPDLLVEVSAPAALETGMVASTPFAVKVLASDGVTPLPGATVAFSVVQGAAEFTGCGAATNCTLTTGANGIAQVGVDGAGAGAVVLSATEVSGGATVQVSTTDIDPVRSVAVSVPNVYVAAGAGGNWIVGASVTQDGSVVSGVGIAWQTSTGLTLGQTSSVTGSTGLASTTVSAPVVTAGSVNTLAACAGPNECADWTMFGVDPSQWQVTLGAGAAQNVSGTTMPRPVTLLVTDSAGHGIQGATVTVYQRVLGWQGTCTEVSRCPAAPVLASSQVSLVSAADGTVTVTPLTVPGVPQTVQIAATTGTEGFVTTTLMKAP